MTTEAAFAQMEDDVNIVTTWIPNTEYENKLRVAISGGSSPDVMSVDSPTIASFVAGGALHRLDDLWAADDLGDLTGASLASVTFRGHVWAVPIEENTAVILYRG